MIVQGGYNVYGYDIGVLMLDSVFPRIPGDIGNAQTWDFPVLYKKVSGRKPGKIVLDLSADDLQPFIEGARELEQQGVNAITTSCGFLSLFQEELSSAVSVPVLTSALLLAPMVKRMLGNRKVGIITANSQTLTEKHLLAVGVNRPGDYCIIGLEGQKCFTNFTVQNWDSVDISICKQELLNAALALKDNNPDIGALVLECTNMAPFSFAIGQLLHLPVFDIVSLVKLMHLSFNPQNYLGRLAGGV